VVLQVSFNLTRTIGPDPTQLAQVRTLRSSRKALNACESNVHRTTPPIKK